VLDAINRRGRAIPCKVTCVPLLVAAGEAQGVIVLMEPEES
jgi:two-component system CheB/CheR fusion protein